MISLRRGRPSCGHAALTACEDVDAELDRGEVAAADLVAQLVEADAFAERDLAHASLVAGQLVRQSLVGGQEALARRLQYPASLRQRRRRQAAAVVDVQIVVAGVQRVRRRRRRRRRRRISRQVDHRALPLQVVGRRRQMVVDASLTLGDRRQRRRPRPGDAVVIVDAAITTLRLCSRPLGARYGPNSARSICSGFVVQRAVQQTPQRIYN